MIRSLIAFAALPLAACSSTQFSQAETEYGMSPINLNLPATQTRQMVVRNDSGGHVVKYAMAANRIERSGVKVRFAGRCDSSCTMYIGLPRTCIEPGAYFRFHAPSARSSKAKHAAMRILYNRYPGWTRQWIASHGGLTGKLITMDYAYASRFLPKCESA